MYRYILDYEVLSRGKSTTRTKSAGARLGTISICYIPKLGKNSRNAI